MALDSAPTVPASSRCRRRFFPASSARRRASRRWRPDGGGAHRFLRTQVDKLRERHCDHIKTIEVREREFEVVKNEMAEVAALPQRAVEGAKARKVDDPPCRARPAGHGRALPRAAGPRGVTHLLHPTAPGGATSGRRISTGGRPLPTFPSTPAA